MIFYSYVKTASQYLTLILPVLIFFGKAPTDIACSLIALLFLSAHLVRKDFGWIKPLWVKAGLLLWGYLVLRSFYSPDVLAALGRTIPWGRYLLFGVALWYWVVDNESFSRKLLFSVGVVTVALAMDGLLQYVIGHDVFGYEKHGLYRLTGPFGSPRLGYVITWIAFPVLVSCLKYSKDQSKIFALKIICFVLVAGAVIASGDRTPMILLFFGVGLVLFLHPVFRRHLIYIFPVMLVTLSIVVYSNPTLHGRYIDQTGKVFSAFWESAYGKIVLDSKDIIISNPIFGVGIRQYRVVTTEGNNARLHAFHPHNFYLEMWAEAGIVGLFLLLLLFCSWIVVFFKNYQLWKMDHLILGLIVGVTIRLWPIIANPSFYASWNVIPLWLLLGWTMAELKLKSCNDLI
ncbi:MAG: O-antigen ligase family protein [Desulfuromonadales bacterium]|nr:O-antigen ligase family protein [Desulfuromonadales bacterium]MBN2791302.1 O-antigen ligase family protein [Desulfuromonadales bacterium]